MRQKEEVAVQTLTRLNFLSKREMAELPMLLVPDEQVLAVVSGFYTAGTAILCVTSKRILLIDKKLVRLSFEDVRFESIKEVNYSHQAIMASLRLYFSGRELEFKAWYRSELRMVAQLVQQKMFEVREKLHRNDESVSSNTASLPLPAPEPQAELAAPQYRQDPQLEAYLKERIARWRKASRFVDTLTVSSKAGRQILELEVPKQ